MGEPTPPPDDHIEDLLSQLQGIFGRLAGSEDEDDPPKKKRAEPPPQEFKRQADPLPVPPPVVERPPEPVAETPLPVEPPLGEVGLPLLEVPSASETTPVPIAPVEPPAVELPVEAPSPEPQFFDAPVAEPPPVLVPEPAPMPFEAPAPEPEPEPMTVEPTRTPEPLAPAPRIETPISAPTAPDVPAGVYQSQVASATDGSAVPTAVFFPMGRDAEARALSLKLETMTPKFTKVAFRLRVAICQPYDPRSDWRELIVQNASKETLRAVFVAADRPLDDSRKRELVSTFELQGIYFQEVPMASIEKKAFYTDLLLGLVFFFDSLKPRSSSEPS